MAVVDEILDKVFDRGARKIWYYELGFKIPDFLSSEIFI